MRIGSLFSGYGGLERGVRSVLGGTVAWHSEIDPGACKILAHRHPGVPNLGDISAVDWTAVEPVDVLTGGFPCQDVSAAGKRLGLRPGTRSGLWAQFAYAIDQLHPSLVVIENVRGLLSADAHSDVEPCPWCVGDDGGSALRALGAVLGDLADLGYDASWQGLRAADVGAPHGRFRVFIVAWPADPDAAALGRRPPGRNDGVRAAGLVAGAAADAEDDGRAPLITSGSEQECSGTAGGVGPAPYANGAAGDERWVAAPGQAEGWGARANAGRRDRASTADADSDGLEEGVGRLHPVRRDPDGRGGADGHGRCGEPATWGTPAHSEGRGLSDVTGRDDSGRPMVRSRSRASDRDGTADFAPGVPELGRGAGLAWGPYTDAVRRWEHSLGQLAPSPTEPGSKGQPRLSPAFVEWMMGLPAGWVTDVPGVGRNDQLKALGNGVVPQQAAHALRLLLPDVAAHPASDETEPAA